MQARTGSTSHSKFEDVESPTEVIGGEAPTDQSAAEMVEGGVEIVAEQLLKCVSRMPQKLRIANSRYIGRARLAYPLADPTFDSPELSRRTGCA